MFCVGEVCRPPGGENNVVWRRLVETRVCCNLGVVLLCVVHVGGVGRVIPPFPVPSSSSGMGMMLGTGASFGEVFMLVAEAGVIAGARSGGSCDTNCGDLHPLAWACRSRARVSGFLGGAVGGPSPRVCCWSPTDRSGVVGWLDILASTITGSGASSGRSVSISSGGAT